MNSICFLMPGTGRYPSGGYKVVYEQANRLVKQGYEVLIVYPVHTFIRKITIRNFCGIIKRYILGFIGDSYKTEWFSLDKEIKEYKVFSLRYKYVPKCTKYCATSLETSYFLNDYPIKANNKIYYIQGYETWNLPEPYTSNSYNFEMKKIAIAPYLMEKIQSTGNTATYIPNGFDFNKFGIDIPIEDRKPNVCMMMYSSNNDIKRCSDMIEAFKIVKEKISDLKVLVFGVPERPTELPEWFEYYKQPSPLKLRELYNNASIFVAASRTEGMALPPAEAFICGCALCCTDIGGFGIYAIHGKTALLSPVFDIQALSKNIKELILDNKKRISFAREGSHLMADYTWDNAFHKFLEVLEF